MIRPNAARVFTALVAVGILVGSLLPPKSTPQVGDFDKVEHVLAYLLLGSLATLAAGRRGAAAAAIVVALCGAFGGLIEIVQPLVGRSRDLVDWLADVGGAVVGVVGVGLLARLRAP